MDWVGFAFASGLALAWLGLVFEFEFEFEFVFGSVYVRTSVCEREDVCNCVWEIECVFFISFGLMLVFLEGTGMFECSFKFRYCTRAVASLDELCMQQKSCVLLLFFISFLFFVLFFVLVLFCTARFNSIFDYLRKI